MLQYPINFQIALNALSNTQLGLTPAERNYSQIEKEALTLVYAFTKFHRYLLGHKFTLLTDHKPLVAIFGSKAGISIYTASRLQRWALTLANYDFTIRHVNTASTGQADMLSRLISNQPKDDEQVVANTDVEDTIQFLYYAETEHTLPVGVREIAEAQSKDEVFNQVKFHIANGWPKKITTI